MYETLLQSLKRLSARIRRWIFMGVASKRRLVSSLVRRNPVAIFKFELKDILRSSESLQSLG
jgi:hypothetical protein